MNAVQMPGLGQFGQVAPDCLQGHVKALGEFFDDDAPLKPSDFKDFRLPNIQSHARNLS